MSFSYHIELNKIIKENFFRTGENFFEVLKVCESSLFGQRQQTCSTVYFGRLEHWLCFHLFLWRTQK